MRHPGHESGPLWRADRRGDHVLPTGEALRDVAVRRVAGGALAFTFTRPLRGSAGVRGVNASSPLSASPTPFNWGLFPSWAVRGPGDHPVHDDMHVRWSHRPTVVNLATGEAERGAEGMGRALVAHGACAAPAERMHGFSQRYCAPSAAVLMALAWGLFFPGAAAAARHLKPAGGPTFFYAHLALNGIGFVLLCAGFGAVYQSIRSTDGPDAAHFDGGFHTRLGLAVFILAWLQPLNGLLRPAVPLPGEKPSTPRRLWELGHRLLGRGLIAAALLAAATGIALAADHGAGRVASQAGLALWIIYCVLGLGGGSFALELLRRRREAAGGTWGRLGA